MKKAGLGEMRGGARRISQATQPRELLTISPFGLNYAQTLLTDERSHE